MFISRREYNRALDESWREGRDKGYVNGMKEGRKEAEEQILRREAEREAARREAQRKARLEQEVALLKKRLERLTEAVKGLGGDVSEPDILPPPLEARELWD